MSEQQLKRFLFENVEDVKDHVSAGEEEETTVISGDRRLSISEGSPQ